MADLVFLEDVDSVSPNSAGCSWKQGRAVSRYLLNAPGVLDLGIAVQQILGNTTASDGAFALKRVLPLAHPAFQWMYASAITEIRGSGQPTLTASPNANVGLEVKPISNFYALYPIYYFTIEFTPRPYVLLKDNKIKTVPVGSWFDEEGNVAHYGYAEEWLRYTDWEPEAQADSVTATQGEMIFRGTAAAVKDYRYPGMPRMFLNNQLVKFTWYQVPFSFVASRNSFIKKYRGRINQYDWFNWRSGELLYLNYRIIRYTPPVQALTNFPNPFDPNGEPGAITFSTAKFVDIEFQFLETVRTTDDDYTPTNGNWLVAGHNLLPIAKDRKNFHYATSYDFNAPNDQTKWVPSWLSAPIPEILFCNPDAPQPP